MARPDAGANILDQSLQRAHVAIAHRGQCAAIAFGNTVAQYLFNDVIRIMAEFDQRPIGARILKWPPESRQ